MKAPLNKLVLLACMLMATSIVAQATDTTQARIIKPNLGDTSQMNNAKMDLILREVAQEIEGQPGYWQINYHQRLLIIITDQNHNRMRIIAPIVEEKEVKKEQLTAMLEAQFDRVLDVKYALYNEFLWSVFAHPLAELTKAQFIDALTQVYFAAENFGTSYQSTDIIFGAGQE